MKNTKKTTAPATALVMINGVAVTAPVGSFAIVDVSSPSHMVRARRVYLLSTTIDACAKAIDALRDSTKIWLMIVRIA